MSCSACGTPSQGLWHSAHSQNTVWYLECKTYRYHIIHLTVLSSIFTFRSVQFLQYFIKKGQLFISNRVAHTEITFKLSSSLLVNLVNLHDQLEPFAKSTFFHLHSKLCGFILEWLDFRLRTLISLHLDNWQLILEAFYYYVFLLIDIVYLIVHYDFLNFHINITFASI